MFGKTKNTSHATTTTDTRGAKGSLIQKLLRTLQFLSSTVSLILFSLRIAKIIRLTNQASKSNGAVEGILAAAVLYTLIAMALSFAAKRGLGNIARILLIIFDLLFVGAFIAVAVLTSPKRRGSSGPCTKSARVNGRLPAGINCNLPWGTFILAIISTLLHAITAAFHVAKDHRRTNKDVAYEKNAHHDARDGFVDGSAPGHRGATQV
ncbi:hypothetical protein PVAG01_07936 [Phlyctema vagabunda]|uniref:MARVEL domain-containing protein n=1 Tax=Phlyctema vagabunda TaxID=108571 RepID=A0ABR4PEN0_9HELO